MIRIAFFFPFSKFIPLQRNQRYKLVFYYKAQVYLCCNLYVSKLSALLCQIVKISWNSQEFVPLFLLLRPLGSRPVHLSIFIFFICRIFVYNVIYFSKIFVNGYVPIRSANANAKINVFIKRDVRIDLIAKLFLQKARSAPNYWTESSSISSRLTKESSSSLTTLFHFLFKNTSLIEAVGKRHVWSSILF